MDMEDIERINELYRKKKAGTLTPEEQKEQERLRQAYRAAVRANLKGTLDHTKVQYPDGSVVDLSEKFGNKGKNGH